TDREDDLVAGVKSTAILFGRYDLAIIALLQLATLALLVVVGQIAGLGLPYWISLGVAAALFGYEHWISRHRDPQACFRAFLHNNWVGMAVFGGILVDFVMRG